MLGRDVTLTTHRCTPTRISASGPGDPAHEYESSSTPHTEGASSGPPVQNPSEAAFDEGFRRLFNARKQHRRADRSDVGRHNRGMNLLGLLLGATLAVHPPVSGQGQGQGPAPAPSAAQPPAAPLVTEKQPELERRDAYGMLLAGSLMTAGFVWGPGLVAASKLDSGTANDREVGRVLPVPIVGPFIAANVTNGTKKDKAGYAFVGVAQMIGISLLSVGAVGVHRNRMYDAATGKQRDIKTTTLVGMISGGLVASGLLYGMTVGFSSEVRRTDPRYGRRFLIPVFGGIAAAPRAPSNMAAVGALTSSALQVAGVGLATAGIVLAVRQSNRKARWAVMPSFGRDHARLTASVRF